MEVKKEQIQSDIMQLKAQLEQLTAAMNQTKGALITLEGIVAFMDKEEPKQTEISDANKAVQDELEAISEQELAEMVAGPGAVVEAIEDTQHEVHEADIKSYKPAWVEREERAMKRG